MFLVDQLGSSERSIPPLALAELEQPVNVSFLCANRRDDSHLLDREPMGTAPWHVRRVEEFIEAHWDQPITIEALAVATGGSTCQPNGHSASVEALVSIDPTMCTGCLCRHGDGSWRPHDRPSARPAGKGKSLGTDARDCDAGLST
jgi:hypothetical protein